MSTSAHEGASRELLIAGAVGSVLLCALAATLGVWEPWEAQRAAVLERMLQSGDLLRVPAPGADPKALVPVLPYGWWPALGTVALFGATEIGLRLPGLLLGCLVLFALFDVARSLYGRRVAWFSVAAVLCMPLFGVHVRHLLQAGTSMALISLAALGLIALAATDDPPPRRWRWGGWLATAAAGLVTGVPGVAIPIAAGAATAWARRSDADDAPFARLFAPVPALVAAALVLLGWWRAAAARPDGAGAADLAALLLWTAPLEAPPAHASWPTFEQYVHQIGFGLYPLAAPLPFALGLMVWSEPPDGAPRTARWADQGVAAWFAAAFLAPALAVPETHTAIFPGAPAAALAVGVYLARFLRERPQPVLAIGAALILFILHRNLKTDTRYLAETLLGAQVEAFPPALDGWWAARVLAYVLVGVLVLYQLGVPERMERFVRAVAYPRRRLAFLDGWATAAAILVAAGFWSALPAWVDWIATLPVFGPLVLPIRRFLVLAVMALAVHGLVLVLWNWRVRCVAGRDEGRLSRFAGTVGALVGHPRPVVWSLGTVLVGWAAFHNVALDDALTTNFSQKEIIERYEELADSEEPLFKYRLNPREASFYARRLPELRADEFRRRATAPERFFAIIPRARLAAINSEFRAATGRTLPVLDAESFRFLLVSNRLEEGETDHSPINRALVDALPSTVRNRVSIRFDDRVELIGWELDPEIPRAGSPMRMTLYWKVLKPIDRDWRVFVHIDTAGARIHGDHDPVEGLYPTSRWTPGDIVRDEHRVLVKSTSPSGRYTFYAGLYQGSQRMKVTAGPNDGKNRARLGYVTVR